jgi:hypothetical protein
MALLLEAENARLHRRLVEVAGPNGDILCTTIKNALWKSKSRKQFPSYRR